MKRHIIQNADQNAELHGLEVHLDRPWWDDLKDKGITPSSALQTPSDLVL